MLDVSQIQSGKVVLRTEETELCSVVEDVIERLGPQMIDAGTVPTFACHEKVCGNWDRFRIEQAVTNLLTNAMKYGNRKPVEVTVSRRGMMAELQVRDYGVGIAQEDQLRIFRRFERAVNKNEVSGLGIGLFITDEIAKLHHGKVWVQSEFGKGSTFFLELPLQGAIDQKESA